MPKEISKKDNVSAIDVSVVLPCKDEEKTIGSYGGNFCPS